MNSFTNIRTKHECFCTFLPPFVLENLARAGVEDAALTIQQDSILRTQRAFTVPNVTTLSATPMKEAAAIGKGF